MALRPEDRSKYAAKLETPKFKEIGGVIGDADKVPIQEILIELGTYVPDHIVGSWKVKCPFGAEHKDGGIEPHFRVYPTNVSHCFAMHGNLTPSQLIAYARGVTRKQAAILILEPRGLLKGQTYRERWASREAARRAAPRSVGDTSQLVTLLQSELAEKPYYGTVEFDPIVTAAWDRVLLVLDRLVAANVSSLSALREWHDRALVALDQAALTAVNQSEYR